MTTDTPTQPPAPELKPCPFCGAVPAMGSNETKESYPDTWFVRCGQCGTCGPEAFDGTQSWPADAIGPAPVSADECKRIAVERWNERSVVQPPAPEPGDDLVRRLRTTAETAFYGETTRLSLRILVEAADRIAALEREVAASRSNHKDAWSAIGLIREAVETLGPVGAVAAGEHLDAPTFDAEARAIVAGISGISGMVAPSRDDLIEEVAEALADRHDMDVPWSGYAEAAIERMEKLGAFVGHQQLSAATAELARLREGATDEGVVEEAAQTLWHRFAPDHRLTWEDETHRDEYRDAVRAITPLIRARVREECAQVCEAERVGTSMLKGLGAVHDGACNTCARAIREGRADG